MHTQHKPPFLFFSSYSGHTLTVCVLQTQCAKSDAEQAIQATTGGSILASPGVPVLKSEQLGFTPNVNVFV